MNQLPILILQEQNHRGSKRLFVSFSYNSSLISIIKSIDGASWSKSKKSWYVPHNEATIRLIYDKFSGVAHVNDAQLHSKTHNQLALNPLQKDVLSGFEKFLRGKRYSERTIQTYTFFVGELIRFHQSKAVEHLTNRDVELFIEDVFIRKKYSVSSQRQFISAVKLFVVFEPKITINGLQLERPKKDKKLPKVLSQEEVLRLIGSAKNLKHRAIIALLYSCGLRISELIHLHLKDFNIERKQLIVRQSKGRKDRYVSLAESFIPLLKTYYYAYKPKVYFVEGPEGEPYSAESVRQFLRRISADAGLNTSVNPHMLRHSYATHLLENGVDIRYIQTLLGHSRPETTMIYTHVKREAVLEIRNPLDTALQKVQSIGNEKDNVVLSRKFIG